MHTAHIVSKGIKENNSQMRHIYGKDFNFIIFGSKNIVS